MGALAAAATSESSKSELAGLAMTAQADVADLNQLLDAYERSLILTALGAVGGRQRRAAQLLRILPSTLHEKMKRLGIRPQRRHESSGLANPEAPASLHWRGSVAPGGTLELRGLNGPVRIEAGHEGHVEVSATRRGPWAVLHAIEVKIVEHQRGVSVCAVYQGLDPSLPRRRRGGVARAADDLRVDLFARVPPGLHVVASTVNDDIEVLGLANNVEAGTANGRVRFLPAPPNTTRAASSPAEQTAPEGHPSAGTAS